MRSLTVHVLCALSLFLCGLVPGSVLSADYPGGAKIVRVDDGLNPRCIDATSDEITITLTRILISKERGWFTVDTRAGVQVSTSVTGINVSTGESDTSTINRVYVVKVEDYSVGQISLPLEGNVVGPFRLTNQNIRYGPFQVSAALMKSKGDTPFGSVIRALASLTKESPFPAAPTSPGYKLFGKLTDAVLADENDESNKIDQKIPTSTISLNFSQTKDCRGDISETTGTFAVVFGSDQTSAPGYVDIKDETNYCFTAVKRPSFALLVGRKTASECKPDRAVANDYMMFFKSAYPVSGSGIVSVPKPSIIPWLAHGVSNVTDKTSAIPSYGDLTPQFKALLGKVATARQPGSGLVQVGELSHAQGQTYWKVNAAEWLANDYVVGLRRCEFNGVAAKDCGLPTPPSQYMAFQKRPGR